MKIEKFRKILLGDLVNRKKPGRQFSAYRFENQLITAAIADIQSDILFGFWQKIGKPYGDWISFFLNHQMNELHKQELLDATKLFYNGKADFRYSIKENIDYSEYKKEYRKFKLAKKISEYC